MSKKKRMGGKRYFRMIGLIDGRQRRGCKIFYAPLEWPVWARHAYQSGFYEEFYR